MRRWFGPAVVGLVLAALGWHGALVAFPRVLMRIAERRISTLGGYNHLGHGPLVTAQSRAVVRPSPDLLYSTCPFDVSAGPVLIDIAPIDAPYWSLSVFDHATNVAFVRNNRQSGGQGMRVAILGAGQVAPAGYQPVTVKGATGVALIRILIDRTKPIDKIDRQRRQSSCRPA